MKFISRIIFSIFANALAILAAAYFVNNFVFRGNFIDLIMAAVIFTLINIFVRPLLKFILGPLIVLTFGLFLIIINALTLYLLDILSPSITIIGLRPLILATLIISFVNLLINFSAKLNIRH